MMARRSSTPPVAARPHRRRLRGPVLVVLLFCLVGVVSTVVVVDTLRDPVPGRSSDYSAVFTSAEGLHAGDHVTVAGVRVGTVGSVERTAGPDGTALAVVRFSVVDDVPVDQESTAAIRYGDMLGVRYVDLEAPLEPSGRRLQQGERIPVDRTSAPIDLTAIFNGFKPLFDALDPGQVNALARSITAAFGGEQAGIRTLLTRVADVTGDLADHSEVISRVVDRLGVLVSDVRDRGDELTDLIDGLSRLGGTMAGRNDELIAVLEHGSAAAAESAGILSGRVDTLTGILDSTREITGSWAEPETTSAFRETMGLLPELADSVNRMGTYGSWLQLYTCTLTAAAGDAEVNLLGFEHSGACR